MTTVNSVTSLGSSITEILKNVSTAETALKKWANSESKSLPRELLAISRNRYSRIPFGTIVRVKPNQNEYAIVLENEGGVRVYGRSGEGLYGREEVSISKTQSVKLVDPLRLYLPYGIWVCENGTEVLFNRDYCPIWVKYKDGRVEDIAPEKWVSFKNNGETWINYGGPFAWYDKKSLERCLSVLKEWGVENRLPTTMNRFLSFLEDGGQGGRFKVKKDRTDIFNG